MLMVDFGSRLKNLRIQNKLTQGELARKIGVTKSVISAYENDLRLPSYVTLVSISKVFNVTTDFLLGIESTDNKHIIDLSGLTDEEISALRSLIKAMKRKK